MRLSREQMVDVAEDLRCIIEAGLLSQFSMERLRRVRETATWALNAPWQTQVEADHLAGIASKCIGGSARQWHEAALAALGCRHREEVGIELLREMADRVREEQCSPSSRRSESVAEQSRERDCPIRSTLGNRNRKRGGR